MYNEKANNIWINRLKRAVEGKRVLLVGNSPTVFSHKREELIDSYDFVVRFGKGVITDKTRPYIGSKCNMWFTGTLRFGLYKVFNKVPFKVLCYSQINLYKKKQQQLHIPKFLFDSLDFQIYRDYFLTGTATHIHEMINRVYDGDPVDETSRISQGAFALTWLLEDIKTQAHIDLIGFDFNTAKVAFRDPMGNEKVAYSWHIPLNKKNGLHENIHASGHEARYVEKHVELGNVTWHKDDINDLNMEFLEEIAKSNRPKKGKIYRV